MSKVIKIPKYLVKSSNKEWYLFNYPRSNKRFLVPRNIEVDPIKKNYCFEIEDDTKFRIYGPDLEKVKDIHTRNYYTEFARNISKDVDDYVYALLCHIYVPPKKKKKKTYQPLSNKQKQYQQQLTDRINQMNSKKS